MSEVGGVCTCSVEFVNRTAKTAAVAGNGSAAPSHLLCLTLEKTVSSGAGGALGLSVHKLVVEELSLIPALSSALSLITTLSSRCDLLGAAGYCERCLSRQSESAINTDASALLARTLARNNSFTGASNSLSSAASRAREKPSVAGSLSGFASLLRLLFSANAMALCTVHMTVETDRAGLPPPQINTSASKRQTKRLSPQKVCHAILLSLGANRSMLFIDSQTSSQTALYVNVWQKHFRALPTSLIGATAVGTVPMRSGGLFDDGVRIDTQSNAGNSLLGFARRSRGQAAVNQSKQQQQQQPVSQSAALTQQTTQRLLQRIKTVDYPSTHSDGDPQPCGLRPEGEESRLFAPLDENGQSMLNIAERGGTEMTVDGAANSIFGMAEKKSLANAAVAAPAVGGYFAALRNVQVPSNSVVNALPNSDLGESRFDVLLESTNAITTEVVSASIEDADDSHTRSTVATDDAADWIDGIMDEMAVETHKQTDGSADIADSATDTVLAMGTALSAAQSSEDLNEVNEATEAQREQEQKKVAKREEIKPLLHRLQAVHGPWLSIIESRLLDDAFPCSIAHELLLSIGSSFSESDESNGFIKRQSPRKPPKKKTDTSLNDASGAIKYREKAIGLLLKALHDTLKSRSGASLSAVMTISALGIVFCILCIELCFPHSSSTAMISNKVTSKLRATLADNLHFVFDKLQIVLGSPELSNEDCLKLFVIENGLSIDVLDADFKGTRIKSAEELRIESSRVEYAVWLLKRLYQISTISCETDTLRWNAIQPVVAEFDYAQKMLLISPQKVIGKRGIPPDVGVDPVKLEDAIISEAADENATIAPLNTAIDAVPSAAVPVKKPSKPPLVRQNSLVANRAPIAGHRLGMGRTHAVTVNPQLVAHNLKVANSNPLPAHLSRKQSAAVDASHKTEKRHQIYAQNQLESPAPKRSRKSVQSPMTPSYLSPAMETPIKDHLSQKMVIEGTPMDYYDEEVFQDRLLSRNSQQMRLDRDVFAGDGDVMMLSPLRTSRSLTRMLMQPPETQVGFESLQLSTKRRLRTSSSVFDESTSSAGRSPLGRSANRSAVEQPESSIEEVHSPPRRLVDLDSPSHRDRITTPTAPQRSTHRSHNKRSS